MQRKAPTPPTLRMTYQPPTLNALSTSIKSLINKYTNGNVNRIRLIHILEALDHFVDSIKDTDTTYSSTELRDIYMGAEIFCIHYIGENANSSLVRILLEDLGIDELRTPGEQGMLVYLEKFYSFLNNQPALVNTQGKLFDDYLADKNIRLDAVKKDVNYVVYNYLAKLHTHILSLSQIIPTSKNLADAIAHLDEAYSTIKEDQENKRQQSYLKTFTPKITPNEERLFLIQLSIVSSVLIPRVYGEEDTQDPETVTLHQRIMMGFLWFIIQSIDDSYTIKYFNQSELFKLACKALHIISIDDDYSFMNRKMQEICLTAFESFINDHLVKADIEKEAKKIFPENNQLQYIHPPLRKLIKKLDTMNDKLQNINPSTMASNFPAAMRLSSLMSLMADPLFPVSVGIGACGGLFATNALISMKAVTFVTNTINALGALLPGGTGSILAYVGAPFAAHRMVEAATISTFSVGTHYLLKTMMFLTGGLVGALIIDIPTHQVQQCYELLKKRMGERLDILEAEYNCALSLQNFPQEAYYYHPTDWNRIQLVPLDSLKERIDATRELDADLATLPQIDFVELDGLNEEDRERLAHHLQLTAREDDGVEKELEFDLDDYTATASRRSILS